MKGQVSRKQKSDHRQQTNTIACAGRTREALVEGESFSAPVTGRPQPPHLLRDRPSVFLFPLPHSLLERSPPKLPPPCAFLFQSPFHHHLSGYACMVCPWKPEHCAASHSLVSSDDVLESNKHGMAHVETARDVWWGHAHGVRLARGPGLGPEKAPRLPPFVQGLFGRWLEVLAQLGVPCRRAVCKHIHSQLTHVRVTLHTRFSQGE
jgi:hypothetical protein